MDTFFLKDPATPSFYTLSLHDALPICREDRDARVNGPARDRICVYEDINYGGRSQCWNADEEVRNLSGTGWNDRDRKSTRLNSSHSQISYAVFCLKKKK